MKHTGKITIILLSMFILTQLIGLFVLMNNPLDIQVTENETIQDVLDYQEPETTREYVGAFSSIVFAFIIAILILLALMSFKIEFILKAWFFLVIVIALTLAFLAIQDSLPVLITLKTAIIISLALALPLAYMKLFKRYIIVHNLTELLIYPGIAAVFVPILNFFTMILLLLVISAYDMWAVWHSGVMQKMAKYQIKQLKVFSGFFVPYLSPSQRKKIKKEKEKYKAAKTKKEKAKFMNKKIKTSVAILGGGDVIFPIITAGVMLKTFGTVSMGALNVPLASLLVIVGATSGLAYLFLSSEKKKFYPAMPFITSGIFIAIALSWIIYTKFLGIVVSLWPLA